MSPRPLLALLFALALPGCSSLSASLLASKRADYHAAGRLTPHTIRVAGHEVVYLDRGGAGEPMLLVHGFGGDKDNWTFLAKEIPDTYRVIALDLPGFGESTRDPSATYDTRTQAMRLGLFADALGLAQFHLAGNSMGGAISARFTLDHPERVKSLALLDAAGVQAPHPSEVAIALSEGRNPLVVQSRADYDRLLSVMFVKPPDIPGFIKDYFAERAETTRAFNEKIFADTRAKPDVLTPELGRITAPTLILWGDKDRIIDVSAAQVFQAGIPGARTVLLVDCGHTPMIERPEETAEKYLAFLREASAR